MDTFTLNVFSEHCSPAQSFIKSINAEQMIVIKAGGKGESKELKSPLETQTSVTRLGQQVSGNW